MTKLKAFTLIELLVVMSIIILVLAVMVPTIKTLTGNHSLALAQNRLSVMLAAAREAAIDNQQIYGLAIYPDITTGDTMLGFVQNISTPGSPVTLLDIVSGTEQSTIQRGVTAQLVINTPTSTLDRYAAIGVVLFDSHGHLLIPNPPNTSGGVVNVAPTSGSAVVQLSSQLGVRFQLASSTMVLPIFAGTGFALYDTDTFNNQMGNNTGGGINPTWCNGGTIYYALIGGTLTVNGAAVQGLYTTTPSEGPKELWMDSNGLLLMVNQFTGELVEGQI